MLSVLGALIFVSSGSFVESTYRMEHYCNAELSFVLESIYQAKLQLKDDNLYETAKTEPYDPFSDPGYCEATIEARYSIYSKLMFYFENIALDCDKGHLEFYNGEESASRVEGLSGNICGKEKPKGVFKVDVRSFRIKYVPKTSQYTSDLFSLIITSFGEGSCPIASYGHECSNSRCINDDIACNGYDSCGDDSGCDLGTGAIVGIVIASIVGVGLITCIVGCCICCNRRSKGTGGTVQGPATTTQAVTYTSHPMTSQPMYGMNQGTPYPTSMQMYPVNAPTNVTNPDINQQGGGVNYQTNQTAYTSPSDGFLNAQAPPSDPPPSYDKIIGNN